MARRHAVSLLIAAFVLAAVGLALGSGASISRAAMFMAALLASAGLVGFCLVLPPRRVMLLGLSISAICFVIIPGAAALLHVDSSSPGRAAALWPVWMYFCLAGPAIITAGVMRFMPYRPPGRQP